MKINVVLPVMTLLLAGLFSCQKEESGTGMPDPDPEIELAELVFETTKSLWDTDVYVEILDGNGGYTVLSDRPEVATAVVEEDRFVVIRFQKNGNVLFTITDKEGKSTSLPASVAVRTKAVQSTGIIWDKNTMREYSFTLSFEPYGECTMVNPDTSVLLVEQDGMDIVLKPQDTGYTTVEITDERGCYETVTARIWDTEGLTFSTPWIDLLVGHTVEFSIIRPEEDDTYSWLLRNADVADVKWLGDNRYAVTGLKPGEATLKISNLSGDRTEVQYITVR